MNPIKVSVSVPVYNAERYLKRCLDSLISQTLKEIEIILVDDGSTDTSGRICDEYATKDVRINVLHKENGGSASARQVALENSHGEYMIVCDSDDWVEPTMYEEMYRKAKEEDADMVICDFEFNYPDGRHLECRQPNQFDDQTEIIKSVLTRRLMPTTWNKLTRLSFYKEHDLSWVIGINQGEDGLMFHKQLQYPMKIVFLPKVLYHYWRDSTGTSYTHSLSLSTFKQILYINDWKHENLSAEVFGRELFASDVNVAFAALRTNGMNKKLFREFSNKWLGTKSFITYKVVNLKALLAFISKISYPLSRFLTDKLYKYFCK